MPELLREPLVTALVAAVRVEVRRVAGDVERAAAVEVDRLGRTR